MSALLLVLAITGWVAAAYLAAVLALSRATAQRRAETGWEAEHPEAVPWTPDGD